MVDLSTTQRGRGGRGGRDGCGGLHRGFCFKILLRQSLVGIFPIRLSSKYTEGLGAFLEGSQPPPLGNGPIKYPGYTRSKGRQNPLVNDCGPFFPPDLGLATAPILDLFVNPVTGSAVGLLTKMANGLPAFFYFIWPSFYSRGFCNGLRLHVKFFFCRMGLFTFSRGLPSTPSALYLFTWPCRLHRKGP